MPSYDHAPKKRHSDWNQCCLMYKHINWAFFRRPTSMCFEVVSQKSGFWTIYYPWYLSHAPDPKPGNPLLTAKSFLLFFQCGRHSVAEWSRNHREIEKLLLLFSTLASQMVVWGVSVAFTWVTVFLIHVLQLPQNSFPVSLSCKLIKYSRMCQLFGCICFSCKKAYANSCLLHFFSFFQKTYTDT